MLTLVPTPIGNLQDISLRALEALSHADILLCEDTRTTRKLLHLLTERTGFEPANEPKFQSFHAHNEKTFLEQCVPAFFEKNIVYVSDAGMPGISDPGAALIHYCQQNGIAYDVLPGANAALIAYVMSGFLSTQFLFFGFLPHKGSDRQKALQKAMSSGYVTILYESPHRIEKLLDEMAEMDGGRRVCCLKELTKSHQKVCKGLASVLPNQMKAQNLKGEWVVVIDAKREENPSLGMADITAMDLPPKIAAKLIAKLSGRSVKECYEELVR